MIGARRASWRIVNTLEDKEYSQGSSGDGKNGDLVRSYKRNVEQELENVCNEILEVLEKNLIPNTTSFEGKVFYYKMMGDYHRYLAEFQDGDKRDESKKKARESYSKAQKEAEEAVSAWEERREAALAPMHQTTDCDL